MLFLLLSAALASTSTSVETLFLALPAPVGGLDRAARAALLHDPAAHVVVDKRNGFLHVDKGEGRAGGVVVEAAVFEGKSRVLLAVTVREDCALQYFHVYDVDHGFTDVTAAVVPVVTMSDLAPQIGGDAPLRIEVKLPRHGSTVVATEAGTCERLPPPTGTDGPGVLVSSGHWWGVGDVDLAFDGVGGFVKKQRAPQTQRPRSPSKLDDQSNIK